MRVHMSFKRLAKRRTRISALTRVFPRVAPPRPDRPIPPLSAFAFPRLPLAPSSDIRLALALYSICILDFYARHRVWPRLAAPGCACGIEVLP
jgi:hypothetical protein